MEINQPKVLVVDDEEKFRNLAWKFLTSKGFQVLTASNGIEALGVLKLNLPVAVILSDYKMPDMDGLEFFNISKEISPMSTRVMTTAYSGEMSPEAIVNDAEIFRFISKPVDMDALYACITEGIDCHEDKLRVEKDHRNRHKNIQSLLKCLQARSSGEDGLDDQIMEIRKGFSEEGPALRIDLFDLAASLSSALDLINPLLHNHHKQVCYIATAMAETLNMPPAKIRNIFLASILHDLGAVAMSNSESLLDFDENAPHQHARLGAHLLEKFSPFKDIAPLVKFHHVRWNHGAGKSFRDEPVPLESHLVHLADRIAVLLKPDIPVFEQAAWIRRKISEESKCRFYPDFVDAFMKISKKEVFWLDTTGPFLENTLKELFPVKTFNLDLDGLTEFSEFYSSIIDMRSRFTANHSSGVAACAETLAQNLGFSDTETRKIKIAGYLHDLGKMVVPKSILEKRGKLDDAEWQIIRSHTYYTFHILNSVDGLRDIAVWAACHHENLSGTGYPFHYGDSCIPPQARIIAVADIFTALAEDRPYRKGMDRNNIYRILEEMVSQKKIDPSTTQVLLNNYREIDDARKAAQENHACALETFPAVQ